ncbi:Hypothetical predicted protein [Mytilus galloprovincialis]|uniref:Reverse transcriptase zinc-binding domain-containing protein n=1 Tax=Mytilus galloprovincialis TaxID=29158 RepID=A0A8B6HG30_MYTGA|nr:Hypothetical predicted protein [Mytilus galloprovincialis]
MGNGKTKKDQLHEIRRMDGQKISFLLRSVYDVLPTTITLTTWTLIEDSSCKLCGRLANLKHILSSCRTALKDGKYTWRHDQVRREKADMSWRKKTKIEKVPKFINFIKGDGESSRNTYSKASERKVWRQAEEASGLGMEKERRAVEELAGSWLNLINSVGVPWRLSWTAPKQSRRWDPTDDGTS